MFNDIYTKKQRMVYNRTPQKWQKIVGALIIGAGLMTWFWGLSWAMYFIFN